MNRVVNWIGWWFFLLIMAVGFLTSTTARCKQRVEVSFVSPGGNQSDTVLAEVAIRPLEKYVGLSDHDTLPKDSGMLFVYRQTDTRSFVMRDMNFPINMIFIGETNRVTAVYHATLPDTATGHHQLRRYRAPARFVLEVNRGWATENKILRGSRMKVDEKIWRKQWSIKK
ncbi:MAG: DUF192 domain-containing protein [bacterium]